MSRKSTEATALIDKLHETITKLRGLLEHKKISKQDIKLIRAKAKGLNEIQDQSSLLIGGTNDKKKMIQGVFDGKNMLTENDSYPVPANYASKSKLIPGDILKLTLKSNGEMVYKLIAPAQRKHLKGILHKKNNQIYALGSDNNNYSLNAAAVTFHKGHAGDEVAIIVNADTIYGYAALECIMRE